MCQMPACSDTLPQQKLMHMHSHGTSGALVNEWYSHVQQALSMTAGDTTCDALHN